MNSNKNIKTSRVINYKIFAIILIAAAVIIAGIVLYRNSQKARQSVVFSPRFMLSALWDSYKKQYWDSSGRTIDKQRNNITTSEGQSYTMLRAVWQDDKPTFDKTWQWTQGNLQRPNDHLFAWLYGQLPDGNYGVLTSQGGGNSATDADTDIATALLFASSRWNDPTYAQAAKNIITDIWNNEIITINGKPYVAADNVEKNSSLTVLVNPSYLAPYAYRLFVQVDPSHNWNAVIDSSYAVLQDSSLASLGQTNSSGLPPDWILLNRQTGQITPPTTDSLTTNYGYDALRVPFRVALDWQWNQDSRAQQVLSRFSFLNQQWQDKKLLYATYGHNGQVVTDSEVPAMYGGSIGYFLVSEPKVADDLYKNKLQSLYSPDFQDWKKKLSYYDDNWAWFGLALYNQDLPNLFHNQQTNGNTTPTAATPAGIIIQETQNSQFLTN